MYIDGTGPIFGKGMKRPKPGRTKVVFGAPLWPNDDENTRRYNARIEEAVTRLGDEALTDYWTATPPARHAAPARRSPARSSTAGVASGSSASTASSAPPASAAARSAAGPTSAESRSTSDQVLGHGIVIGVPTTKFE